MDLNVIFLIGPQGSGKGTQAQVLARRLGFFYWNMGGILREERDLRLSTGETVGEIIDTGKLLDDQQLLQVFEKRMHELPSAEGVIFDGVPRRVVQAEFLMDFLRKQGRTSFLTLLLDVPRAESVKRLLLRSGTEGRADDTPEAIEYRLRQYEEATVPMLEYLKTCTTFVAIDGTPPIPEVTQSIFAALDLNDRK